MTLKHCDHEFVCRFYVDNGPCIQPDILSSVCEHDSRRSRPTPSTDCVKCLEEDRVTMLDLDAAIAAQARSDIIKTFAEVERLHDVDGITYPDLYNEFIERLKKLRSTGGEP